MKHKVFVFGFALASTKLEKENELEENLQNFPIERKTLKQLIIHVYVDRYF
jgi:hypothetical protein